MRFRLLAAIVLAIAVTATACSSDSDDTTTTAAGTDETTTTTAEQTVSVGSPVRGREIWETGGGVLYGSGCSQCHSIDGSEQTEIPRKIAPSFLGISERAGNRVPGLSAEEYLQESILDPAAYIVEGYKNNMSDSLKHKLNEEDVDSLIAFMLTL